MIFLINSTVINTICSSIFMGRSAIRFPTNSNYIYIIFVSLVQLCIVYVVKDVASLGDLGQLIVVARKRMHAQATDQQKGCKTANNCWRNSIKMMQESLSSKCNKLMSFRQTKLSFRTLKDYILQSVHQRSMYLGCNYTYFFRPQFKGRDTSAISND